MEQGLVVANIGPNQRRVDLSSSLWRDAALNNALYPRDQRLCLWRKQPNYIGKQTGLNVAGKRQNRKTRQTIELRIDRAEVGISSECDPIASQSDERTGGRRMARDKHVDGSGIALESANDNLCRGDRPAWGIDDEINVSLVGDFADGVDDLIRIVSRESFREEGCEAGARLMA